MLAAVLRPESPLVVVVHGEAGSQVRNEYEQALVEPVLRTLANGVRHGRPERPAGARGHRHRGALPARRADGYHGQRHGE
jgi:hypothetical protein